MWSFQRPRRCRSLGTRSLATYLCHLPFVSLLSCSFQYTGLSPPWLNLFLSTLLFLIPLQMGCFSLHFSFYSFIISVKKHTRFFCINFVSCNFTKNPFVSSISFLMASLEFLSVRLCHPQTVQLCAFLSFLGARSSAFLSGRSSWDFGATFRSGGWASLSCS